jgi:HK97 family phage major capsid protein
MASETFRQSLSGMSVAGLQDTAAQVRGRIRNEFVGPDGNARAMNNDDREVLNELLSQIDTIDTLIATREQFDRGTGMERASFEVPGSVDRSDDVATADVTRMGDQQARDAALRVLESRGRALRPEQGNRVDTLLRTALDEDNPYMDGAVLARRLLISESDAYRSAFAQIMSNPHPILTAPEAEAVRALQRLESRAMGEQSGPVGLYGVPVLIDPSVLLSAGAASAPIMDACRVIPVTTNLWKGVSSAPPQFSWDTESSVVSDDSPTLAQPSIPVYTMRGFLPYSLELGMDYPSFAAEMQGLLEAGYIDLMASTTCNGTGTNQPTGLFTKLDATAASEVRLTTAGQLGAVDVFKAWNALPERFRTRASWVMSVSTESQIRSFSSPSSTSSFFTVDLTQQGISMINGRPVVRTDYAPTFVIGTSGTQNALVVGDLSQYIVPQRIGLQVEPLQMLYSQQTAGTGFAMPTGTRGFFGYARAGADVAVPPALRLLNQT